MTRTPRVGLARPLEWMEKYVKGEDVDTGPAFRWVDQNGDYYSSNVLPTDADFYGTSLVTNGPGALLPIIPVIGGSGPSIASIPYSLGDGSPARNAVNVPITNPTEITQVVGAPTLTMTYSGNRHRQSRYGQIVDKKTGLVVEPVSSVPVTVDGNEHTVSVPLADIVYTMAPDSDLELQIVSFATAWASFTQFGAINVQSVRLELPTAADAMAGVRYPGIGIAERWDARDETSTSQRADPLFCCRCHVAPGDAVVGQDPNVRRDGGQFLVSRSGEYFQYVGARGAR